MYINAENVWKIINKMTSATYNGTSPNIMIALYEYGNSGLPQESGYIRKVTDLTSDLDILSRDLFSLKTNGGNEFCGQVIQTAFNDLDWSASTNDLQMIFIAGNEPFNQGKVDFKPVCQKVKNNDITINTIFCGAYQEVVNTKWKKGAELGEGEYLSRSLPNETVGFSFGFSGVGFSFVNKFSKRKITGMFDNGSTIFILVNM